MVVYLNGEYVPSRDARVPVTDRGFLFADGVYEVVRIYGGVPFLMEPHLERFRSGLSALGIRWRDVDDIPEITGRLLRENGLEASDATVYMQITRGAPARRTHAFPAADTPPTVYIAAQEHPRHPAGRFEDGVAAVTVSDTRWTRCDIKSVSLLPNVLANQHAHERGAFEALFVRDGVILEGSHSNLFGVRDGALITYPVCNYILPGITRALVLELARELGLPVREGPIREEWVEDLEELFLSGTTTEVMPIATLDGRPVGGGRPGAVARRLQEAYCRRAGI